MAKNGIMVLLRRVHYSGGGGDIHACFKLIMKINREDHKRHFKHIIVEGGPRLKIGLKWIKK